MSPQPPSSDAALEAAQRQYDTYVRMAEAVVDRRSDANRFYLTLNTGLVGAMGFLVRDATTLGFDLEIVLVALAVAGLMVSLIWRAIIVNQRSLMAVKFGVVHEMEKSLPLAPYTKEWNAEHDTRKRISYARFEMRLPLLFAAVYLTMAGVILREPIVSAVERLHSLALSYL